MQAALDLKAAAVSRTWEKCLERGVPEKRCKSLLQSIHQQELKVVTGLSQYLNHPDLNMSRVSAEMSTCRHGFPDYNELVRCQARLLDRIKAAMNGETLLAK